MVVHCENLAELHLLRSVLVGPFVSEGSLPRCGRMKIDCQWCLQGFGSSSFRRVVVCRFDCLCVLIVCREFLVGPSAETSSIPNGVAILKITQKQSNIVSFTRR